MAAVAAPVAERLAEPVAANVDDDSCPASEPDKTLLEAQAIQEHASVEEQIKNAKAVAEEAVAADIDLTTEAKKYKYMMDHGSFPGGAHSKEAREFEKEFKKHLKVNDALNQEYLAAGKNYDKQRDIKKRFAGVRFENVSNEKSQTETLLDLATVDAEYCTFPRAWDREGRDATGFRNTKTYFGSVVQKWMQGVSFYGHPYCKWDEDRKTGVFLHKREKVKRAAGTEWSLKTIESDTPKMSCATSATSAEPITPAKRKNEGEEISPEKPAKVPKDTAGKGKDKGKGKIRATRTPRLGPRQSGKREGGSLEEEAERGEEGGGQEDCRRAE